ncbi:hypothetical protein [Frigoriglobus tundricola]|uniref:DUF4261 domain-containing protein n=1 Tax=Frigoriglobus tundricola TaxID=2774151 RepID=A0A6M5YQN0_9BACT|nr:hypothetical protein [Frigoriglobus tundricola]QJW96325.1 hypothetical protein FTUN_3882 [Frigoriglobus tundricola]
MAGGPKSWPRPHFTPGGGNPLLFFAVFGAFDLNDPFHRSKYRSNGPGDWLAVNHLTRAESPEVFASYQSGPIWKMFDQDVPVTAAEALQVPEAVAVRGEVTDPDTLDYFRDAIGVVTWLLDRGGVSIYDPQRFWLWSADEWRDEIFAPGEPQPQEHTVILVSEDEGEATWLHTRGMRQYGRPDLSVHGVGATHIDAVTQMIERFIELQAYGGVIPDGEEIRTRGLPPGGVCRHRGNLEDPDFNNVHIAIEWQDGGISD